ncbi:MAG: serine/threonine-protein kinase [Polyangia bacterium]
MDSAVFIGPYRLLRRLSKGGMGSVHEALHEAIERRVAIKILSPEHSRSSEIVTRFFNEARAVNRIADPGLVQIFDHGQLPDGTAYIVMEMLHGETLGQRVRRMGNRLPVADILRLLRQVAATLTNTHAKGIVHRDLKPDNIMIVEDAAVSGGERTKVLDFGIAKLREPSAAPTNATRGDLLMGTPGYMSPEQCRGAGGVDDKTDVYAFGVMLFRLLAGRMPFIGSGAGEVMAMHQYEEPPSLAELTPWVPEELCRLVEQLLRKDKAARPTMRELLAELDRLQVALKDFKMPELPPANSLSLPGVAEPEISSLPTGDDPAPLDSDSVMPTISTEGLKARAQVPSEIGYSHSQPSTLQSLNGESKGHTVQAPPPAGRSWLTALGAAGLLVAVGAGLWLRPHARSTSPAAPQTAAPAAERLVRWSITTTPPGAEVLRLSDGKVLGHTPLQAELPAGTGTEDLRLRLAGHSDQLLRLGRDADSQRQLTLQPVAPPPAVAPPDGPGPKAQAKSEIEKAGKPGHRTRGSRKKGHVRIEFEE